MNTAATPATVIADDLPFAADTATLNFFRPIPPNGRRCSYCGLGHAALYRHLVHGPARQHVRVANLRMPGQVRAQTLFHVGDLVAYLSHLAKQQRADVRRSIPVSAAHGVSAPAAADHLMEAVA
ncbi:MAG: hypothetical protein EXS37_15140 [Opitutus sp.]|nr:hypothetical protein [Opitutus sp.]